MSRPEPEWWAEARALWRGGLRNYSEIGRRVGRGAFAVRCAVDRKYREEKQAKARAYGKVDRDRLRLRSGKKPRGWWHKEAQRRHAAGHGPSKIARDLGVNRSSVTYLLSPEKRAAMQARTARWRKANAATVAQSARDRSRQYREDARTARALEAAQ